MSFKKRAVKRDTPVTQLPGKPLTVIPTGGFDGNDGKWSTFAINIGDSDGKGDGQNFKVLISTSSALTLVPEEVNWCNADCAKSRGVGFFRSQQSLGFKRESSSSWRYQGQYDIALPEYWYGTKPNATYGSDNVGLGESSPQSTILAGQWVAEYTYKGFYMGSFGLAAGPVDPGSGRRYPFLTNLAKSNYTPSVSYGYTAGAIYRNDSKGVPGNLVLGGFDQARFSRGQATSITMPSGSNNTLVVGVQSIVYHPDRQVDSNDYSFTNGSTTFWATIDSTLPYLWLPNDICDQFAYRFKLTYDNATNMYMVNASSHEYNKKQNATVTFKIGSSPQDSQEGATITLPYSAFDLEASSPLVPAPTNYFPIKKSPNGVFILGRTFLQEAYIVVDYERANFTVAPAVFSDPMPNADVVPIYAKGYTPPASAPPTSTPPPSGSKNGGLAPGAIAGVVVGIVILFLLFGLGAFLLWKKRREDKKPKEPEIQEIDTAYAGDEIKHHDLSELDNGKPLGGFYGDDRDNKDVVPFPPITEMESPPAELYSPPLESTAISSVTPGSERNGPDYFSKPRRRGATRESSGNNTPGTPGIAAVHELPGDDGQFQVGGIHFDRVESPTPQSPAHSRGPSDTSLQTNIDEVIAGQRPETGATTSRSPTGVERRPSHARGASDTTVHSDTTAVSQPTPEEMENWALGRDDEPRRPLSE